ncbi:hypothetical protein [Streptomyces sp. E1N211]|uniref:hypothetical protein n=1 Tax=Streptomyces sp. E1N211 TaxID=1851876 RepID=UPI0012D85FF6|nr:hypothetical protein [Streptomyces sp. E1N211]
MGDTPAPYARGVSIEFTVARSDGAGNLCLEAAGVTTFVLAGRYFEARAKRRAGAVLRALLELGAKDVTVLLPDGGEETGDGHRHGRGRRVRGGRPGEGDEQQERAEQGAHGRGAGAGGGACGHGGSPIAAECAYVLRTGPSW